MTREKLSVDQILETALDAFAFTGYRGTSLGDVATKLGVTRQALYYYFDKKHDILAALFEDFFDRLDAAVQHSAHDQDDGDRFEAMFRAHLRTVAAFPHHSTVFTREFDNLTPDAQRHLKGRRRAYNDQFISEYEHAVRAGTLISGPADAVVGLVLGAANWTFWWFREGDELSLDELTDLAVEVIFQGLRTGLSDRIGAVTAETVGAG